MHLYAHQQKIIDEDKPKTGLFLGTGSGKTLIALLLARGKTLVICPKTQKQDRNWEREAENNNLDIDLTVMSKEEFKKNAKTLSMSFRTVILDECHTMLGVTPNTRQRKNKIIPKASQIFEAIDDYLIRLRPDRLYLVTATIIRSPMTVYAAAQLLGRHWDFYDFRNAFYVKLPMGHREVYAPRRDGITKDRLASVVQKLGYVGRLQDYVDLPEQIFKTDYVALTEQQKKRIREIPLEYPDPLVSSLKKHMIENGILNGDEFSKSEEFKNEKIEKILDYSLEFPQIIVFARYKAQIAQISTAVEATGRKVYILTGDTKNRGQVILDAKNSKEYVFICQSQVSAGWELPDCPVVIFASLDFSIVSLIQAQGRISRINNPKTNLYIYLIAGKNSIDEHVYKTVVETKMDFHLAIYTDI